MEVFKEIMSELTDRILEKEINCKEDLDDVVFNVTMHPVSYDIGEDEIKQCLAESETVGHIVRKF